jgi:Type VI secretion system, TssN
MQRIFSGEFSRVFGILGLSGLFLTMIAGRLIARIRGSFQPYVKNTIVYLLVVALFFAAIAFLGHPSLFTHPLRSFIILQLVFMLLGILHIYYLPKFIEWAADEKLFPVVALYTFIVALFGYLFFIAVFKWVNASGYHYLAGAGALFFIIPVFVYRTFVKAIAIPPKIFRLWYYPVDEEVQEPGDDELKNMLVVSFEFQKKLNEPHFTNFRAKAPRDMGFGQLFYYFINDYGERHPNNKIEFSDTTDKPYAWIFYKKPRWYSINTDYIDTDKTFYANRIRENDVIVCHRSLNIKI